LRHRLPALWVGDYNTERREENTSKKHHSNSSSKSGPSGPAHRRHPGTARRNLIALWIGIGVLVVFAAAFLIFKPAQSGTAEITAAQAYEKSQADALFVDVRTQEEWNQGHIAKSILIPLDQLPSRMNELPKDQDIVVICHTGARAKQGATILHEAGFPRVRCMTGGLQAWISAGYPIEQ
jgi:rhodanese-related sulfurtransferase